VTAQAQNGGAYEEYLQAEAERYRHAAEKGDAAAQINLGNVYWDGKGVEQDREKAAMWYRRAADQGHATGQQNLGY